MKPRRFVRTTGLLALVVATAALIPAVGSLLVALSVWAALVVSIRSRSALNDGPRVKHLIPALAAAKLVATAGAYGYFTLLHSGGDASFYDQSGQTIAAAWAAGESVASTYPFPGTGTIEYLAGALSFLIHPSAVAGYLLFSAAGFAGAYLWYRAVRLAAPELDAHRLALLMLGMPSVLFWTAPISKDAVVMLALGMAALGGSFLMLHRASGILLLAPGLGLTMLIRPHLAAMFAGSLCVAVVLGRSGTQTHKMGMARIVVGGLAIAGALFALRWFGSYSSLADGQSASEIQQSVASFGQASGTGASAFEAQPATSLLDLPQAILNVVFRPTILDIRSPLMLLAALESTYLLVFGFVAPLLQRRLRWRQARHPMFILGCAFVMLFAFAFSNFANFGYLARQRAQIMPILGAMTLLLLPRGASAGRNHGSALAASVADSAPKGLAVADGNVR